MKDGTILEGRNYRTMKGGTTDEGRNYRTMKYQSVLIRHTFEQLNVNGLGVEEGLVERVDLDDRRLAQAQYDCHSDIEWLAVDESTGET